MPSGRRNPGTIDWPNSESRAIILDDLENGIISLDGTDTAEELFYGMYQFTPEFIAEKVLFKQFRDRLKDHRAQITRRRESEAWEASALAHDRQMRPIKTHNARGEKVFYWTEAADLLKKDVAQLMSKNIKFTASQIQAVRPSYYGEFKLAFFDRRVRQAVRRQRYINYLNDKRLEEEKVRRERRKDLLLAEETPWQQLQRMSLNGERREEQS